MIVSAEWRIEIGPPIASGSAFWTASAKRREQAVVVLVDARRHFRRHVDERVAVRRHPAVDHRLRQRRARDFGRLQQRAQLRERDAQRLGHRVLGALARGVVGTRELRERLRQVFGLGVAGARMIVGGERELVRQALQRGDPHRVRDRRRHRLVERRQQLRGGRADQFELLRLVGGDQALRASSRVPLRAACARRSPMRSASASDGASTATSLTAASGASFSAMQRRHRLRVRVFQVQRIEVETQVQQQRQRADHDDQRADQHGLAVAVEEFVDGCERRKAGRTRFARRREHLEQRRKQRHVGHNTRRSCRRPRSAPVPTRRDRRSAGTRRSSRRSRRRRA